LDVRRPSGAKKQNYPAHHDDMQGKQGTKGQSDNKAKGSEVRVLLARDEHETAEAPP
jgi:hypothetical protein